jgi:hypothetical protein
MQSYDNTTTYADEASPKGAHPDELRAYGLHLRDAMTLALAPFNRGHTRLVNALSAIDKDAAGYRIHNAANHNGGQNARPGELARAIQEADTLLVTLTLLNHQLGNRIL